MLLPVLIGVGIALLAGVATLVVASGARREARQIRETLDKRILRLEPVSLRLAYSIFRRSKAR